MNTSNGNEIAKESGGDGNANGKANGNAAASETIVRWIPPLDDESHPHFGSPDRMKKVPLEQRKEYASKKETSGKKEKKEKKEKQKRCASSGRGGDDVENDGDEDDGDDEFKAVADSHAKPVSPMNIDDSEESANGEDEGEKSSEIEDSDSDADSESGGGDDGGGDGESKSDIFVDNALHDEIREVCDYMKRKQTGDEDAEASDETVKRCYELAMKKKVRFKKGKYMHSDSKQKDKADDADLREEVEVKIMKQGIEKKIRTKFADDSDMDNGDIKDIIDRKVKKYLELKKTGASEKTLMSAEEFKDFTRQVEDKINQLAAEAANGGDEDSDGDGELTDRQLSMVELFFPDFDVDSDLFVKDLDDDDVADAAVIMAYENEKAMKEDEDAVFAASALEEREKARRDKKSGGGGDGDDGGGDDGGGDDGDDGDDDSEMEDFIERSPSSSSSKRRKTESKADEEVEKKTKVVDVKKSLKKTAKGLAALKNTSASATTSDTTTKKKSSCKVPLINPVDREDMRGGCGKEEKEEEVAAAAEADGGCENDISSADYVHRRLLNAELISKIENIIKKESNGDKKVETKALCAVSESLINVLAIDYPVLYETLVKSASKLKPRFSEAEKKKVPLSVFCRNNKNWLTPKPESEKRSGVPGVRLVDMVYTLLRADEVKCVLYDDSTVLSSRLSRGLVGKRMGVKRVINEEEARILWQMAHKQANCAITGKHIRSGTMVSCEAFTGALAEDRKEYEESLRCTQLSCGKFDKAYSPQQTSAADLTAATLAMVVVSDSDRGAGAAAAAVVEAPVAKKQDALPEKTNKTNPQQEPVEVFSKEDNLFFKKDDPDDTADAAAENIVTEMETETENTKEMDIESESQDKEEEMDTGDDDQKSEEGEDSESGSEEEGEEDKAKKEIEELKKKEEGIDEEKIKEMGNSLIVERSEAILAVKKSILKTLKEKTNVSKELEDRRKKMAAEFKDKKEEAKNLEEKKEKFEEWIKKNGTDKEDEDVMDLVEKRKEKLQEIERSIGACNLSIKSFERAIESCKAKREEVLADNRKGRENKEEIVKLLKPYEEEIKSRGGKTKMKNEIAAGGANDSRKRKEPEKEESEAPEAKKAKVESKTEDKLREALSVNLPVLEIGGGNNAVDYEDDEEISKKKKEEEKEKPKIHTSTSKVATKNGTSSSRSFNAWQIETEKALTCVDWTQVSTIDVHTEHRLSSAKGTKNNLHSYNVINEVSILGNGFHLMMSSSEVVAALSKATHYLFFEQQFGAQNDSKVLNTINTLLAGCNYDAAPQLDSATFGTLDLERKILEKKMSELKSAKGDDKLNPDQLRAKYDEMKCELEKSSNRAGDSDGNTMRTTASHLLSKIRLIQGQMMPDGTPMYDYEALKYWMLCIAAMFTHPIETIEGEILEVEKKAIIAQKMEPFSVVPKQSDEWEKENKPLPANHLPFGRHVTSNETLLYLIRCVQQAMVDHAVARASSAEEEDAEQDDQEDGDDYFSEGSGNGYSTSKSPPSRDSNGLLCIPRYETVSGSTLLSLVKNLLIKESRMSERELNAFYKWNELRAYNERRDTLKKRYERERKEMNNIRDEIKEWLARGKSVALSARTSLFLNCMFPHHY